MQALSCHDAWSADIASWAPSRDKSVKLFSRASVPPAIVSKDDRGWNFVLADIVQGEHIDNGSLLRRRRAVPFHFRHPSPVVKTGSAPSRLVSAFGKPNRFTSHAHGEDPCVRIIKTRNHQT